MSFVHIAPAGVSRFVGAVSRLSQGGAGQVQISGPVLDGVTAAGVVLTGEDFFSRWASSTGLKAFSLPSFAEAGRRSACTGGSAQRVPITVGVFVALTRDAAVA